MAKATQLEGAATAPPIAQTQDAEPSEPVDKVEAENNRLATVLSGKIEPLTMGRTVKTLATRLYGIFTPAAASDKVLAKAAMTILRELVYTHGVAPASLPDRLEEFCEDCLKPAGVIYGSLMATPDGAGCSYEGYTPPCKADGTIRKTAHPSEIAEALVGSSSTLRRCIGKA